MSVRYMLMVFVAIRIDLNSEGNKNGRCLIAGVGFWKTVWLGCTAPPYSSHKAWATHHVLRYICDVTRQCDSLSFCLVQGPSPRHLELSASLRCLLCTTTSSLVRWEGVGRLIPFVSRPRRRSDGCLCFTSPPHPTCFTRPRPSAAP